jgi:hypothetical protein
MRQECDLVDHNQCLYDYRSGWMTRQHSPFSCCVMSQLVQYITIAVDAAKKQFKVLPFWCCRKAEKLKEKVQNSRDLLNDNEAWVCQQQLQVGAVVQLHVLIDWQLLEIDRRTLTVQNSEQAKSGNFCCHSLQKFLSSYLPSRNIKIATCNIIILCHSYFVIGPAFVSWSSVGAREQKMHGSM